MHTCRHISGSLCVWIATIAVCSGVTTLISPEIVRGASVSWQQFDLVTLGSFSSPSDVEGTALIGTDVTGSTWNAVIKQTATASTPTLIVGGTLAGTVHVEQGSLLISSAADVLGTVNYNGGGSAIYDSTQVSSDVSLVTSQLESATAAYATLAVNNTATFNGSTVTFNATTANANGVAVFSVTAQQLLNLGQNAAYDLGTVGAGVTSIIINVTGSGSFSEQANFIGNWGSYESTTLWNFSTGITSITTNRAWDERLMALGANLTNTNDQNGAVFVDSMTAQSEVHLPLYDGYVPVTVPEPESFVLLSTMSTIVGLWYVAKRLRPSASCRRSKSGRQ